MQTGERVMVDTATYQLMHPRSRVVPELAQAEARQRLISSRIKLDSWPKNVKKSEELSEKVSMLLPSSIFAFRLRAKKWSK